MRTEPTSRSLWAALATAIGSAACTPPPVPTTAAGPAAKADGARQGDVIYVRARAQLTLYRRTADAAGYEPIPRSELPQDRPPLFWPVAHSVYRVAVQPPPPAGDPRRYARIIGESRAGPARDPFWYLHTAFVELAEVDELGGYDRPLTFTAGAEPADKRVIILMAAEPRVLLLEGDAIVHVAPAVLGRHTPYSSSGNALRIRELHLSRNMTWVERPPGPVAPMHPGVGFALRFAGSAGYYFHNSPWWDWRPDWITAPQSRYGSAGCVNLPDKRWRSYNIEGRELSFAELLFRWAATNITCERDRSPITDVWGTDVWGTDVWGTDVWGTDVWGGAGDADEMQSADAADDVYTVSADCPLLVHSVRSLDELADPPAVKAALREQLTRAERALQEAALQDVADEADEDAVP